MTGLREDLLCGEEKNETQKRSCSKSWCHLLTNCINLFQDFSLSRVIEENTKLPLQITKGYLPFLVFAVIVRSQFFESGTESCSMFCWTRRRRGRSSLWNKCFSEPDCIVMCIFIFFFKEEDAIDIRRMISQVAQLGFCILMELTQNTVSLLFELTEFQLPFANGLLC